jgi:hypothetical protein
VVADFVLNGEKLVLAVAADLDHDSSSVDPADIYQRDKSAIRGDVAAFSPDSACVLREGICL